MNSTKFELGKDQANTTQGSMGLQQISQPNQPVNTLTLGSLQEMIIN